MEDSLQCDVTHPLDARPMVIMKFGGTSVATKEGRAAMVSRVQDTMASGLTPILVVSAMGRKGAPYATDTLLSLAEEGQCSLHESDLLMGVGEIISSIVVAACLREAAIDACALPGSEAGIITDGKDGCASIKEIHTAGILGTIRRGYVPVIAGFQGIDERGRLNTLGRGGSDTTACAIGVALNVQSVDIYTDVDGIMTADPRTVDNATVLERITADELFQMAKAGSKIVHSPAAELALESGIPMKVRSTFTAREGTEVVDITAYRPSTVATAVSTTDGIARMRVKLPYAKDDPHAHMEIQTKVYRAMADAHISIDMFTPMNDRLVFSIAHDESTYAMELLKSFGFSVALRDNLAKVTLIGSGMHGVPGVMARVADCLVRADIDILQVADSHATISVLVCADVMEQAAQALHDEFGL